MSRIIRTLFVIFLCLNASSLVASQETAQKIQGSKNQFLTDRQSEIIRIVLRVDSNLTQEMHAEFWADSNKVDIEQSIANIKKTMPIGNRYLKALWQSARLSKKYSKVIRTSELEAAWQNYKPLIPDSRKAAEEYASSFLAAAASGKPQIRGGKEIYITDDLIDQVIKGLDDSFNRLNSLLDPNWKADKSLK